MCTIDTDYQDQDLSLEFVYRVHLSTLTANLVEVQRRRFLSQGFVATTKPRGKYPSTKVFHGFASRMAVANHRFHVSKISLSRWPTSKGLAAPQFKFPRTRIVAFCINLLWLCFASCALSLLLNDDVLLCGLPLGRVRS